MKRNLSTFAAALLATAVLLSPAKADLLITEVMSTSGATGNLAGRDWWELTNNGPIAVMLAGYEWEDNAPGGFGGDTAVFPNVTINSGESIIIHQGPGATGDADFRTTWGLAPAVQVLFQDAFGGNNPFSGLGSGGDEVNLYDNTGALIASVGFGTSTSGVSFEWDGITGASLDLSVNGENGAYIATYGGVGSPGAAVLSSIPEPASALALLGLAGLLTTTRRRR